MVLIHYLANTNTVGYQVYQVYQARGNLETLPVHLKITGDHCKTVTIDNARNVLSYKEPGKFRCV